MTMDFTSRTIDWGNDNEEVKDGSAIEYLQWYPQYGAYFVKRFKRTTAEIMTTDELAERINNDSYKTSWREGGGIREGDGTGRYLVYKDTPRAASELTEPPVPAGMFRVVVSNELGIGLMPYQPNFDDYVDLETHTAAIQKDIDTFLQKEDEYNKLGLLYRRGLLLYGPPGCHAKGTKVLMYDGTTKTVEDVVVGDQLMGPDSRPRLVLQLCRGRQEMAKIIPTKGDSWVVNQDHILSLSPSHRNDAIRHVLNVSVKDYLTQTSPYRERFKLYRTGVDFAAQSEALPIPPYILGTWLGDGTSNSKTPQITSMDEEIVRAWTDYAVSEGLELHKPPSGSGKSKASLYTVVSLSDKHDTNILQAKLKKLDLLGNKHIPQRYLAASRSDRLELLAGLIDTDGTLEGVTVSRRVKCGVGFAITSKWAHLADQITFLARSLGFSAYIHAGVKGCYVDKKKVFEGTYYTVTISGSTECIPVRIPHKKSKPRKQIKSVLHTGFTVELLPEDDYYGFILDRDHLYVLGDFTVTHNSGKSVLIEHICTKYRDLVRVLILPSGFSIGNLNDLRGLLTDKITFFIFEEITSMTGHHTEIASLLNFLDGQNSWNRSVVIATTNYPQNLPGNIIDRPSRFDRIYKVDNPNADVRRTYLTAKLGAESVTDEVIRSTEGFSVAHLRELVISIPVYGNNIDERLKEIKDVKKRIANDFAEHKEDIGF